MLKFIGFCFVAWFMAASGIARTLLLLIAHIFTLLATLV
jgi:hypothetical protein